MEIVTWGRPSLRFASAAYITGMYKRRNKEVWLLILFKA